jgi:hypothetical protein
MTAESLNPLHFFVSIIPLAKEGKLTYYVRNISGAYVEFRSKCNYQGCQNLCGGKMFLHENICVPYTPIYFDSVYNL